MNHLGIVGTDLFSISLILNSTVTNKGKVAVYAHDNKYSKIKQLKRLNHGIKIDSEFLDVQHFKESMEAPRTIMICESKSESESTKLISALSKILTPGDNIIDVGSSLYMRDIQRRSLACERNSLNYFDSSVFSTIEKTISNPLFSISGVDEQALRNQADILSHNLNAEIYFAGKTGSSRYIKMISMSIETALFQGLRDIYSLCEETSYFKEVLSFINSNYPIAGQFIESAICAINYRKIDQVADKFFISKIVLPFMEETMLLNVNGSVIGTSILNQSSNKYFERKPIHTFYNNRSIDRYTLANALTFVFCTAFIEAIETLQSKDMNYASILNHWAKASSSINCKILERDVKEIYDLIDVLSVSAQKLNIEALKRNMSVPSISAAVNRYNANNKYTHFISIQRNIMYGDSLSFKRDSRFI